MLQKTSIPINFSQGLDTKTDPFQVSPGRFLQLQNTIFNKGGLLQKRNGYGALTALSDNTSTYVTTFNENLIAVGDALQSYSSGTEKWTNHGFIQPAQVSVLPIVRSNVNQTQLDSAFSSNGLTCIVYTEVSSSTVYKYVVVDSETGQNIVRPTTITPSSGTVVGSPRVFTLRNNFVIVFTNLITGTNHLKYFTISTINTSAVSADVNITSIYTPTATVNFDGVVANNTLYLAWNGSDVSVKVVSLLATLILSSTVSFAAQIATILSVTADITIPTPVIYVSYYNSGTTNGFTLAVNPNLTTVLAPTQTITGESVANITTSAQNSVCSIFYEVNNNYGYDATIATHFIKTRTITQGGSLNVASIVKRSVGLASKSFILSDDIYFLSVYSSSYQPSYFLLKSTGEIIAKLAYSEGGPSYTLGLPSAYVQDMTVQIGYLIKNQIQAVNKTQGVANTLGIYSQTGLNMASFTINNVIPSSVEIGTNLNLSGGFLWAYDGYSVVENGFFVWPDYVETSSHTSGGGMSAQIYFYIAAYEWADNQGNVFRSAPSLPVEADLSGVTPTPITFTSVFSTGANSITVSSATGLVVGQVITDTTTAGNITAGTAITSIVGTTVGLSKLTAGNSAAGPGDTLRTVNTLSVSINVPTLRLTYKTSNPVKLVVYRWSTAQQNYYQVSSITNPTLNDPSVDYLTITDTLPDSSILGNNILYTTGGVLENISPPALDNVALFQSRLFGIDAEDKNLLWYSKQVIEATPVEMSDLLTIYVAPTISAQGNTGVLKALSALDDKLILFKKDAIYYITGQGPDNTGANNQFSDPIFITATVGSENQKSIVFMPDGLMFQSDKGIWLLSRNLSTEYIGAAVEMYTQNALVQSAVNVPGTNQVRFTLDSGITLMYDYYYKQWGTFVRVPAVSSTLVNSLHTYLNTRGQVFQETPGEYLDGANPVLVNFTTSWLNLAGLQGFERAYYFYLLATYLSPHKLTISIAYDYNASPTQTTIITPTNATPAWGGLQLWGSSPNWGGTSAIEQWRVFLQQQKCQAFQLSIQESFDASIGQPPGAGFTLSGLNLIIGSKSNHPRSLKPSNSVG